MTLRIGTVPYCNALPLIHYLPEHLPGAVLSEWVPSAMREQLAGEQLDLALMPVAELPTFPQDPSLSNCTIISNCSIACNGAVRSVLLVSRKPIEQIRTLALDTASRSSVKICTLILRHFYGITPQTHRLEAHHHPNDCPTDAFLVIGDRALTLQPAEPWRYRYDIGELWKAKTNLPLVFAVWIGNASVASIAPALEASRDQGLQNLELILDAKEQQGIALPLDRDRLLDYYRRAVVYTMGEGEHAGLQRFFDLHANRQAMPSAPEKSATFRQ